MFTATVDVSAHSTSLNGLGTELGFPRQRTRVNSTPAKSCSSTVRSHMSAAAETLTCDKIGGHIGSHGAVTSSGRFVHWF